MKTSTVCSLFLILMVPPAHSFPKSDTTWVKDTTKNLSAPPSFSCQRYQDSITYSPIERQRTWVRSVFQKGFETIVTSSVTIQSEKTAIRGMYLVLLTGMVGLLFSGKIEKNKIPPLKWLTVLMIGGMFYQDTIEIDLMKRVGEVAKSSDSTLVKVDTISCIDSLNVSKLASRMKESDVWMKLRMMVQRVSGTTDVDPYGAIFYYMLPAVLLVCYQRRDSWQWLKGKSRAIHYLGYIGVLWGIVVFIFGNDKTGWPLVIGGAILIAVKYLLEIIYGWDLKHKKGPAHLWQ